MIERIRKRFIHVTILSVLVALLLIMGTFGVVCVGLIVVLPWKGRRIKA